jgi:hypothetical protein
LSHLENSIGGKFPPQGRKENGGNEEESGGMKLSVGFMSEISPEDDNSDDNIGSYHCHKSPGAQQ